MVIGAGPIGALSIAALVARASGRSPPSSPANGASSWRGPRRCCRRRTSLKLDQIMGYAKKYLEPIPRQEPPPPVRTKEPVQQGERA